MDRARIERLEALLAKATPGPWEVEGACCAIHNTETVAIYHTDESKGYRHIHEVVETGCGCGDEAVSPDNARLIAEAINALPALLRLARAVADAPQARVYAVGMGEGEDVLNLEPRDRQDREAIRDMNCRVLLLRADAADTTAGDAEPEARG